MIKYDEKTKMWSASACLRNPVTKIPTSLRRDKLESKKLAQLVEKDLQKSLEMRFKAVLEPKWPQVFDEYCFDMQNRDMSEKAKRTYTGCLKSAVGSDWDDKFIKDITPAEIKHVIKHKHPHFSESHKKSMRKFFNSIFEFALNKKYVNFNPTPVVKFKIGQKIETTLNQKMCSEFLKLASEQKHEFYPVWFVALHTGMRNGELYALKWKDNLPEMRFHDLRATCATLLLSKGVPLAVVMNILGWEDLKTANGYYRKSAVDLIGATDNLKF